MWTSVSPCSLMHLRSHKSVAQMKLFDETKVILAVLYPQPL